MSPSDLQPEVTTSLAQTFLGLINPNVICKPTLAFTHDNTTILYSKIQTPLGTTMRKKHE